jgi:hypothetical protein
VHIRGQAVVACIPFASDGLVVTLDETSSEPVVEGWEIHQGRPAAASVHCYVDRPVQGRVRTSGLGSCACTVHQKADHS